MGSTDPADRMLQRTATIWQVLAGMICMACMVVAWGIQVHVRLTSLELWQKQRCEEIRAEQTRDAERDARLADMAADIRVIRYRLEGRDRRAQ